MIKVSVIMPCLNVVKYIKSCIDSVICQTLKDIEILIIDAGSTDGTLEILSEYEKKDPRIHIIHSKIKSYGYQMDTGISLAAGEYVGIVETDDFIQPDMFEVLYEEAAREHADYVKGTSEGFYQSSAGIEWRFPILPWSGLKEKNVVVPRETPEIFLNDNFLWNGIYRTEFLKKIKFNETPGAAFQDIGALFQIASRAEKGVYVDHLVYNYRQDNLGASSYNQKSLLYVAEEYKNIEQFLPDLSQEWKDVYYLKMGRLCIDRFLFMARSGQYWYESEKSIEELGKKLLLAAKERKDYLEGGLDWSQLQMFMKNPYLLYESLQEEYLDKKRNLFVVLDKVKGKKVYIFGAGKYGMFLHMFLHLHNIEVIAFCDNNSRRWGQEMQTIPVISPNEAAVGEPDAFYVAAVKGHAREITEQLLQLGIEKNRITYYDSEISMYLLI